MKREFLNKKIIIVVIILWMILVVGVIIYYLTIVGKVKLDVEFAPFSAKVTMNGVAVRNHGHNYVAPGEYHVVVEYENFDTYEATVTIESDTKYLYGTLNPSNEEGEKYVKEHIQEFYIVEGIAGEMASLAGQKTRQEYPIIKKLPIKDPYYNIGYTFADDGILKITVKSSISYRQLAVEKLLEILGPEDFGKYDIMFYDLENPYAGKFKDNSADDPVEYIKSGFSDVDVQYDVDKGTLSGDYYYTYLRYMYNNYVSVIFRLVLIHDDDEWRLAADPYPLLTTTNTPDVPLEIINSANEL